MILGVIELVIIVGILAVIAGFVVYMNSLRGSGDGQVPSYAELEVENRRLRKEVAELRDKQS